MDIAVRPAVPDAHTLTPLPKRRRRERGKREDEAPRDEHESDEPREHEEGIGERIDLTA
ncbi:MAG: hypothetical protein IT454_00680 [Planctomycetes bacterium]|nr:hypothetical protein [Planctomycetota bacterium]